MKCYFCKDSAVAQVTMVINGVMQQISLCEKCIKERQKDMMEIAMQSMFAPLFGEMKGVFEEDKIQSCPLCGTVQKEAMGNIEKRLKNTCGQCYEFFRLYIYPLIKEYHKQHTKHTKTSKSSDEDGIEKLERKLKIAIEGQDFEKAAELRDKIHKLKHKKGGDQND